MASWTDSIPQFNPYVQQLPVEAMVEVGMEKQRRYDEGIQKIQSYVDNIAGLDVVRDIDKAYLQTKLNELGGKLMTVAAGDFSNYQLVNSVGGMANQITKDKYVQNAVGSTAWYRKELAAMEKARSEGKSSEANIYDFNEKANKWLTSNELTYKFNDRYTPYTDVKKKALEAIKALHPNLEKYDIPFEVIDGKINTRKIADAMQRYKIEGVSEKQIQQAIYATMTPDDVNQLGIDARYQFRGVTPEQLTQRATNNYTSTRNDAIASIAFLRKQRGITTDPNKISSIDDSIDYYEELIGKDGKPGKLDEELANNLRDAQNDPNGVKLSLYKDAFVKELGNAFTWKNQEMEYVESPHKKQENFRTEMAFKQQVENRQRYEFSVTTAQKERELQMKAEEIAVKKAEVYGIDSPWTEIGNPTDNALMSEKLFADHVSSVGSTIESEKGRLRTKGYTDDQINSMLKAYADNPNKPNVPANAISSLQSIWKNENYSKSLEQFQKRKKAEAEAQVKKDPKYAKIIEESDRFVNTINGGKPIVFPDGTSISAKEMGDKLLKNEAVMLNLGFGNIGYLDRKTNKMQKISNQENGKYVRNVPGSLYYKVQQVLGYVNKKKEVFTKVDDNYKNVLAPFAQEFVPQIKALGSDKNGAPTALTRQQLSGLITARSMQGVAADDNCDIGEASAMLTDENAKNTQVFIHQNGDKYEIWMKNLSDPSNIQKISVSQTEVAQRFGPGYVNPRTQETYRVNVGAGNTNINRNPTEAFLQQKFGNFPNVSRYNITADLDRDVDNPDLYIPYINVKKKDGRYATFEISGDNKLRRLGFDQAISQLDGLTDKNLIDIIKELYPNYDISQLETK